MSWIKVIQEEEASGELKQLYERMLESWGGVDGHYIVEPVFEEERIIIAELDLEAIDKERMTLDVSGHYQRPDLFDFKHKAV